MKIFKYKLEEKDEQLLELPLMSRILHVGEQEGQLFVWAAISEAKSIHRVRIWVKTTGEEVHPKISYVGTVHMKNGYVLHVFTEPGMMFGDSTSG